MNQLPSATEGAQPGSDPVATLGCTSAAERGRTAASRRASTSATSLEAARERRRKAIERERRNEERVARAVDHFMDQAETTYLSLPLLYIHLTGSLASASVLYCLAELTDKRLHLKGDPWLPLNMGDLAHQAGLSPEDLLCALADLRDQGLVRQRRRYDLSGDQIVVELQFQADEFANARAEIRSQLREDLYREVDDGRELPGGF